MPVKLTFVSFLLLGLLISAALVHHQYSLAHSGRPTDSVMEAPAQEQSGRGPVRMIRFVLLDDGIYPRRFQVDKGLLNIALEDETYSSESLVIESINGDQRTKVTEIARGPNRRRGRALVKLAPGHYLVSVANQPDHKADLIVRP